MRKISDKIRCENCFEEIASDPCPFCGFDRRTYVSEPTVLPVGTRLENRYYIGRVIGKGGFGITYLAYDTKLGRQVAIKEYYPNGLAFRERGTTAVMTTTNEQRETFNTGASKFYEEARLLASFNVNPNLISVYDFFYGNDTVYFTMNYLQGVTLKDYVNDNGRLSEGKAVRVAYDMCSALGTSHASNVLHRDISPDNIMICTDGTIKLLDFGAARQVLADGSNSLSVILKQGFAPLEQYAKKGNQGPWTDIYALGATLYYCLAFKLLDDPMSRLTNDTDFQSSDHGISAGLMAVIRKAVEIKSEDRYQSIAEFKIALDDLDIAQEGFTVSFSDLHTRASSPVPASAPSVSVQPPVSAPSVQPSAPVMPAFTGNSGNFAPTAPAMTGNSAQFAPTAPAMTGNSAQFAPTAPAMTGNSAQFAPTAPAMTSNSAQFTPSAPATPSSFTNYTPSSPAVPNTPYTNSPAFGQNQYVSIKIPNAAAPKKKKKGRVGTVIVILFVLAVTAGIIYLIVSAVNSAKETIDELIGSGSSGSVSSVSIDSSDAGYSKSWESYKSAKNITSPTYNDIITGIDSVLKAAYSLYKDGKSDDAAEAVNNAYMNYYLSSGFADMTKSKISSSRENKVVFEFQITYGLPNESCTNEELRTQINKLSAMLHEDANILDGNTSAVTSSGTQTSGEFLETYEGIDVYAETPFFTEDGAYHVVLPNGSWEDVTYFREKLLMQTENGEIDLGETYRLTMVPADNGLWLNSEFWGNWITMSDGQLLCVEKCGSFYSSDEDDLCKVLINGKSGYLVLNRNSDYETFTVKGYCYSLAESSAGLHELSSGDKITPVYPTVSGDTIHGREVTYSGSFSIAEKTVPQGIYRYGYAAYYSDGTARSFLAAEYIADGNGNMTHSIIE